MDQYYSLPVTRGSFGEAGGGLNASVPRLDPGPVTETPIGPGEAPIPVHYSVTVVVSVLVGILFLLVYVQLIMVICFGYKLLTYQTVLLFDILLWAALRLTLYSFYFYHCCKLVDKLDHGSFFGWFLVSFPSCLQYFSLAVLVHYFGESILKVLKKRQEMATLAPPYRKMKKYRVLCEFLWVAAVLVFLASSLTFHFLIDNTTDKVTIQARSILVIIRVVLLDGLFLVMGITLGVCIIIIYTTRAGKDVLEAQGGRKCVPPFISCLLILLFASRDIYSIVAAISGTNDLNISGYSVFVTVEGDYGFVMDMNNKKHGYIAFFAVLMVWEVIPTYIIVFFFRVRLPSYHNNMLRLRLKPCKIRRKIPHTNQKHFFENPNRYDENEQLLYPPVQRQSSTSTHVSIPSLTGSAAALPYSQQFQSSNGYGSTSGQRPQQTRHYSINTAHHHHGNSHAAHSSVMPGTTPPQLFTSPSFFTDQ